MQIRRVYRPSHAAVRAAQPLQRLRQWSQTPTGCRTCDQVRTAVGRLLRTPRNPYIGASIADLAGRRKR
jgi:hypothetical protein